MTRESRELGAERGARPPTVVPDPDNAGAGSQTGRLSRPVAVIGGGVIGLSIAWRAAQAGWMSPSTIRRPHRGRRGWRAGCWHRCRRAGRARSDCCALGLASPALWHEDGPGSYLDGLPPDVVTARESLVVAVDRADVADLKTVGEWLAAQGHPVTFTSAARDVEPLLAQGIRHGFRAGTELAVDNRAVVECAGRHTANGSACSGRAPVDDLGGAGRTTCG